jgi:hypothetical protein
LHVIEPRFLKVREELTVQKKAVCGHAHLAKTDGFCVPHYPHNVRMDKRLASLQTEARDAELPNVVHPFLEIGQDRMRNRVIELIAIMTIQVALFGHVQVRSPWFGIKNASDLLEREHSFPYHGHRTRCQASRIGFLILLEAIGPKKEEMYLRFVIPLFSVFYLSSCCI